MNKNTQNINEIKKWKTSVDKSSFER